MKTENLKLKNKATLATGSSEQPQKPESSNKPTDSDASKMPAWFAIGSSKKRGRASDLTKYKKQAVEQGYMDGLK